MQNYQHELSQLGCTLLYKLDQNTIYFLLVNINALTSNPMFSTEILWIHKKKCKANTDRELYPIYKAKINYANHLS